MGSASREALAQARTALRDGLATTVGVELLEVAGVIAQNPALASALGDSSAAAEAKSSVVSRLFGALSVDARAVLTAVVAGRWSNSVELVAGIEELGLRAEGSKNPGLSDELLAIADVVARNHDLQLTLGSKLVAADGKVSLLASLLTGKVSDSALAIARQLVSHPRGRRFEAALREAARITADQIGCELATVTVAAPISAAQQARLATALERTAGRTVKITTVIDPAVIGGIRVQMADDVIDGSIRSRLDDLRTQLAA
ncbi:F-type H+-transporting ATPase subunit delta [Leucobacter exalbidus]|uniref:ATP synthase subunit delta n=1 Tax=Leucobacter exalbidus TaxID=662960 RepID=A0A940T556_9MICO|nr:F0F1 ATP synthase subunit delta [Leucobacter exalbidus]MBP1325651.1 F-type H+-transporting ATPase subunit delta [Leucobacter exalbidus]